MTTQLLDKALNLIAPHECLACGVEGSLLCYECARALPERLPHCYRCNAASGNTQVCKMCAQTSLMIAVFAAADYDEPTAKALVGRLKFDFAYQAAETIAQVMAERLSPQLTALPAGLIVTHVPTATTRVRQRGFDQAQLIAKAFARQYRLPYASLLARTSQQRQLGTSGSQRRAQLRHAYRVRKPWLAQNAAILLIDDVITTGSTMEAAAAALQHAGAAQLYAAAFAKA